MSPYLRGSLTVAKKRNLEFKWVQAKTLTANPHNWRTHSEAQMKALGAVIGDDDLGWAGALLFNKRTKRLVDGHGRLKLVKPNDYVPVLMGDWSEEKEKKILLTLDPIAGMAGVDQDKLKDLLNEVDLDTPELKALTDNLESMVEGLMDEIPGESEPGEGGGSGSGSGSGKTPQYMIIIECKNEAHQRKLCQRFIDEKLPHKTIVPEE